jgi:hypothetical protein
VVQRGWHQKRHTRVSIKGQKFGAGQAKGKVIPQGMSRKYYDELSELKSKHKYLEKHREEARQSYFKASGMEMHNMYKREMNACDRKMSNLDDRIRELQNLKLSSGEKRSLMKEMDNMTALKSDRDLANTNIVKVGWSDTLGSYVKIKYTKWSSFMSNVRGMGSLAGKKEIDDVEKISKEEYESLIGTPRTQTTSFMGATQTFVTDPKTGIRTEIKK